MKLYEVLIEATQVDEAPMGMLKTLGNKAMSKMGSGRAAGKLSTGGLANQLHKEFQQYLGKTGREATKDAVMGFLSSKGYPTQGAATIINTALKGAAGAPAGPMANLKATARGVAASAKDAMVKGAGNIADKMKPGLKAAPVGQTDPTMDPETPTTTGAADTTAAAPAKTGSFNNQLGGSVGRSTNPPAGSEKYANRMPNMTYPTTTGVSSQAGDNYSMDPKKKKVAVSAGKINKGNLVAEAGPGVLPQSIIDKAILKAAQEAEIINTKQGKTSAQQTSSGSAGGGGQQAGGGQDAAAPAGGGGFMSGLKQGYKGTASVAKPSVAVPGIEELTQRIAALEKKVGLA